MKKQRLVDQRWKVCRNGNQIDIATKSGIFVMPVLGAVIGRSQIARSIVRDHNAELNRRTNEQR